MKREISRGCTDQNQLSTELNRDVTSNHMGCRLLMLKNSPSRHENPFASLIWSRERYSFYKPLRGQGELHNVHIYCASVPSIVTLALFAYLQPVAFNHPCWNRMSFPISSLLFSQLGEADCGFSPPTETRSELSGRNWRTLRDVSSARLRNG